MSCSLQDHKMTLQPFEVYNLDVYSDQTYDVLFTADQDASRNYWAAVNVRGRKN
jgi:L-ascorbate oxidase